MAKRKPYRLKKRLIVINNPLFRKKGYNMKELIKKHWALISYLFFGALTTAVNIIVYAAATAMGMATGWANALAWALSVAFAYYTNRRWVFQSTARGLKAVLREMGAFVACRLGTGLMDQAIMMLGVDGLGPKLIAPEHLYIWGLALKIASNVLVIILNYIFSKLIIFSKKRGKA